MTWYANRNVDVSRLWAFWRRCARKRKMRDKYSAVDFARHENEELNRRPNRKTRKAIKQARKGGGDLYALSTREFLEDKKMNELNIWHVLEDGEAGTRTFHPWLTENHAKRLSDILNEIEEWRVKKNGLDRNQGHGRFYRAVENKK